MPASTIALRVEGDNAEVVRHREDLARKVLDYFDLLTAMVTAWLWQRAGESGGGLRLDGARGTGRGRVEAWARVAVWFFGSLFIVAYLFLLVSPSVSVLHNFAETMDTNRMPDDTDR